LKCLCVLIYLYDRYQTALKEVTMKRVIPLALTPEDVRTAIRKYAGELDASPDLQNRLPYVHAWYAEKQDGRWFFAPSKWAGYTGMTAKRYLDNAGAGGYMDGRRTEHRLRKWFEPLNPGSPQYVELHKNLASFTAKYGKQPRGDCRISTIDEQQQEPTGDDLADLIVRVARRLSAAQQARICSALRG
jgi:hypothetical protein